MIIQLSGLLVTCGTTVAQGTSVECPGSENVVLCSENQVAICWIGHRDLSERCLTPPEGVEGLDLDLWLLSYVLDDTLTVTDESIESYREIIKRGKWEGSTYKVAFSLPGTWKGTR